MTPPAKSRFAHVEGAGPINPMRLTAAHYPTPEIEPEADKPKRSWVTRNEEQRAKDASRRAADSAGKRTQGVGNEE